MTAVPAYDRLYSLYRPIEELDVANKKNDLDDFDFDDDMFGDMNFGDDDDNGVGKAAKKKHPIRTMSTSFAGGAASAIMSTSALKSFTRAALPKGYTSALEAGEDVFGAASNLYHDAVKELEPAMPAIRKAGGCSTIRLRVFFRSQSPNQ